MQQISIKRRFIHRAHLWRVKHSEISSLHQLEGGFAVSGEKQNVHVHVKHFETYPESGGNQIDDLYHFSLSPWICYGSGNDPENGSWLVETHFLSDCEICCGSWHGFYPWTLSVNGSAPATFHDEESEIYHETCHENVTCDEKNHSCS